MFKPLLRTLPSLSGNFTLACPINNFSAVDKNNFVCNIRSASIIPLQNSISNPINTDVNLLQGKYEFDVSYYYKKLQPSILFFDSKKSYNLNQLEQFNMVADNDFVSSNLCTSSRDTDYEFGVKRISYSQYGYQFMFYAPFYIDSENLLPEKFVIEIKYVGKYKEKEYDLVTKKINVNINKNSYINYLKTYLQRYLKKIDSNVMSFNYYYKRGTYYGIDIKNGGLQEYKSNTLGRLFVRYMNIMDFDEIICNGFKETGQIMRQVIPISFLFNIDDFLTENEKRYLYGKRFKISGCYYDSTYNYSFYDFDINYRTLYTDQLTFDNGSIFTNKSSNIMDSDMGYKERSLDVLLFKNKVTPYITRWKTLQSPDDNPYFINANYSFSANIGGNYGEFPNTSVAQDIMSLFEINNDNGETKRSLTLMNTEQNVSRYMEDERSETAMSPRLFKSYVEHYLNSWHNTLLSDSLSDNDLNIADNWSKVVNNYSYFRGVLYNVSSLLDIYNKNATDKERQFYNIDNIDYFGLFLNIKAKFTNDEEFKKIKNSRYFIDHSDGVSMMNTTLNSAWVGKIGTEDKNPVFVVMNDGESSENNVRISNNGSFISTEEGDFICFEDFGENNIYVKIDDDSEYEQFKYRDDVKVIDSWELVDVPSSAVIDFILKNRQGAATDEQTKNNCRISRQNNSTKYLITDIQELKSNDEKNENEIDYSKEYKLFLRNKFVHIQDFNKVIINDDNKTEINIKDKTYEYVPRYQNDNILIADYFAKKELKVNNNVFPDEDNGYELKEDNLSEYIYVDSYNLNNLVDENTLSRIPYKEAYIRIDSYDMLVNYYKELYKDSVDDTKEPQIYVYKKCLEVQMHSSFNNVALHYTNVRGKYSVLSYKEFKKLYVEGIIEERNKKGESDKSEKEYIKFENGKFVYNGAPVHIGDFIDKTGVYEKIEVNIYIKKRIYLFTEELYKLFGKSDNEFKQLYLLIPEDKNENAYFYQGYGIGNNDNYYGENGFCNKCYQHMFAGNLYENTLTKNLIASTFKSNSIDDSNVVTIDGAEHKIYKYRNYFADLFVNVKALTKLMSATNKQEDSEQKAPWDGWQRYKQYITPGIEINDVNIQKNINDKNCLYVLVDVNIDNSSESFNLGNKYIRQTFDYVNNERIDNDNIDLIFTKYYEYIIPMLKTNVFKSFIQTFGDSVCIPDQLNFVKKDAVLAIGGSQTSDIYKYKLIKDSDNVNESISVNRYFGDCTPYLYSTSTVPEFYSRPMIKSDDSIVAGNYQFKNNSKVSTFDSFNIENININSANSIKVKNPLDSKYSEARYLEYKHFNDNMMYNLEEKIEIAYPELLTNDQIEKIAQLESSDKTYIVTDEWKYENTSIEFVLFKHYMENNYLYNDKKTYDTDNIYKIHFLFLFNKYKITRTTTQMYTDLINNNHLYQLKYTYELK